MSEALSTLAAGGSLITLGYSGGRKATIDVTDLIWKRATINFSLAEASDAMRFEGRPFGKLVLTI